MLSGGGMPETAGPRGPRALAAVGGWKAAAAAEAELGFPVPRTAEGPGQAGWSGGWCKGRKGWIWWQ